MSSEFGFEVQMNVSHDEAIPVVTAALKAEGFGVLTTIEIDKAFREKLNTEFRQYTILGACNPPLAHAALTSKPEIGLLLPCNVTVEAGESDHQCLVRIMNPAVMMQFGSLGADETMAQVARDAHEKLQKVSETLQATAKQAS